MDFPSSPTNGQQYGGYYFDAVTGVWKTTPATAAASYTSDTPPQNPASGDFWWNSVDGTLYTYYADSNSSQWVETLAPVTGAGYVSPNYVINGGMDIWQRGTSIAGTSSAVYSADRWESYRDGYAAGMTVSRQATGMTGFQYCARVQRDSGNTSVAGITFSQPFETVTSLPLAGQTVTLSFYARSGANYSGGSSFNAMLRSGITTDGNFRNGNLNTSFGSSFPALTTSWQRFTLTGTASASATQVGVNFYFTPSGTAGANDYFEITGVQLESGVTATAFRRNANSLQGELAACQRYYWRVNTVIDGGIGWGSGTSATTACFSVRFPVTMRTNPTSIEYQSLLSLQQGYDFRTISSAAVLNSTKDSVAVSCTSAAWGGDPSSVGGNVTLSGNNGYFAVNAEL